jgi:succinate-semialdehyde dehydrogenase/glutarate-semialdehyde dehydrogenase
MALLSINPATGAVLESFPETGPAEIEAALERSRRGYADWRRRPLAGRASLLRSAARLLRANREGYARQMALEMGKPVVQGEGEVDKCARTCDYFADHAEVFLSEQPRQTEARRSVVRFEPLGPVLAIMPWNFPFWQVFRFAAPALLAGNTVVLKHASNVPRCALAIAGLLREAGFPEGVFQALLVGAGAVAGLIADPRVRGVTLTGSDRTGSQVGEAAGRALKKAVLELGGSDPFIVLDDAAVEQAARAAADARLLNGGQSCVAAKRFIVTERAFAPFLARFVEELGSRKVGDPLDRSTQVGPLARRDLRDALHQQVEESVRRGAELRLGGRVPEGPGAYYPPTVLVGVGQGMPAFDEETFGPVAAVLRAREAAEAIRLANDSPYGLGASLWSADRGRAECLAAEIEAGCVFVNTIVRSDPRLPFGGVKRSGYGRELSEFGIREFTNIKTVWIA